jgi:hypothetical protein
MKIMAKKTYRVDVFESERGWGKRLDFSKDFKTLKAANKYVTKINSVNNLSVVPDWYMYAESPYQVVNE